MKYLHSLSSVLLLLAIAGATEPGYSETTGGFSIAPPTEVTPEIVATRGCIEGVEHPGERRLSFKEQLTACNNMVIHFDDVDSVYFRGLFLFENATTTEYRNQAFEDFTQVIESGAEIATAYAKRARLNLLDRNAPDLALVDIDAAIDLTQDRPRVRYFRLRAVALGILAEREQSKPYARRALADIQTIREMGDADQNVRDMESWLIDLLNDQTAPEAVEKG